MARSKKQEQRRQRKLARNRQRRATRRAARTRAGAVAESQARMLDALGQVPLSERDGAIEELRGMLRALDSGDLDALPEPIREIADTPEARADIAEYLRGLLVEAEGPPELASYAAQMLQAIADELELESELDALQPLAGLVAIGWNLSRFSPEIRADALARALDDGRGSELEGLEGSLEAAVRLAEAIDPSDRRMMGSIALEAVDGEIRVRVEELTLSPAEE